VSPVERSLLAFTTLAILAAPAHASHPKQALKVEGTARQFEFVASAPTPSGLTFARQVLPSSSGAQSNASVVAQSRIIYLNHDGVILRPGDNDSNNGVSSIVQQETQINGWDIDDESWAATVGCIQDIYSRFDVTVTDQDPGNVPHIEAVIGGHPSDVGLPDNVAGVSPFTTDCSIIEGSIVFTFTDVLPNDPQKVCEVAAQEIAHSFGLDHEMLPSDPMTYLDFTGDRTFQDEMVSCGEYSDRKCGINGNTCRQRQNSVQLLTARLGAAGGGSGSNGHTDTSTGTGTMGGCSTGSGAGIAMALAIFGVRRRRR
jgi:uncharacterized protein (TIGR03382 family)